MVRKTIKKNNWKWLLLLLLLLLLIKCEKEPTTPQINNTHTETGTSSGGGGGGGGGSVITPPEQTEDSGVKMNFVIVDENGNILQRLAKLSLFQSIISASTPSGYISLSKYDCTTGCSFLMISSSIDNSLGESIINVNDVIVTTSCAAGNTNPSCSAVPNTLGGTSITGTKRGNLNSKYDVILPRSLQPGETIAINSDPMSLDEISFGLMQFKLEIVGNYLDSNGNEIPLIGKYGTLQLNVNPSLCSDGTLVDPDSTNTDTVTYCSTVNIGKYCRVGSAGVPALTDRASLCGCPVGKTRIGEVCL